MESGGIPLLTSVAKESGMIVAAAFDFAESGRILPGKSLLCRSAFYQNFRRKQDYQTVGLFIQRYFEYLLGGTKHYQCGKRRQAASYRPVCSCDCQLCFAGRTRPVLLFKAERYAEILPDQRSIYVSFVYRHCLCNEWGNSFTNKFFHYASIQDVSDEVVTESTVCEYAGAG